MTQNKTEYLLEQPEPSGLEILLGVFFELAVGLAVIAIPASALYLIVKLILKLKK